ncbi:fasciclin domain-containing protein [Streptosporangium sp. KLBMP 9127]|nr:fasciclin domain-containing protein [Streptosporangium sp. KLBMP 9127]
MKKSRTALLASSLAALALAPLSPLAQASAADLSPPTGVTTPTPPEDMTTPGGTDAPAETPTDEMSPTESPTDEMSPTESPTDGTATPTGSPTDGTGAVPFGPGCGGLPATGKGSLESMAKLPAAAAVADNPELSTLSKALTAAGLNEKLDKATDVTLFAPTDEAFSQVPKEDLDKLMADKEQLTKALSYHVVEKKVTKADLSDATLKTMEGADLTVKGSGDEFTVNDEAKITCGEIPTANGTVYIVDKVLMPE